jgi:hypothetical protein
MLDAESTLQVFEKNLRIFEQHRDWLRQHRAAVNTPTATAG